MVDPDVYNGVSLLGALVMFSGFGIQLTFSVFYGLLVLLFGAAVTYLTLKLMKKEDWYREEVAPLKQSK